MILVAVFVGGLVGSGLRLAVDALAVTPVGGMPIGTLAINVVGSFALAILVSRVWPTAPGWLRAGLGPGLLGAFTTFSAVALVVAELLRDGSAILALAYLAVSLAGGLGAAALGLRLGRPQPIGPDE